MECTWSIFVEWAMSGSMDSIPVFRGPHEASDGKWSFFTYVESDDPSYIKL